MKRPRHLALSLAVAMALSTVPPLFVGAEDIDLFVGNGPTAQAPNVLIILDNSANWSAANQNWPGTTKQGQSELQALNTVIGALKVNTNGTATVNIGLMMFTEGVGGGNVDGGYIRFAIRPMTNGIRNGVADPTIPNNIKAFQDLVGDANCTYNPITNKNSVNDTPNCIYGNYDKTEDQVGSGKADYTAAMFEAFKYFGGWTFPDDATANPQYALSPGNPQSPTQFGPFRYAGNLSKSDYVARLDAAAYKTQWSEYNPPISADNNCANNYIIFIGNGYVTNSSAKVDNDKTLMTGVRGDTTHLSMPEFSQITNPTTPLGKDAVCKAPKQCATDAATTYGSTYDSYSCSGGTTSAGTIETATTTSPANTCENANQCAGNGPTYLPGYTSYTCSGGNAASCSGQDRKSWTVTGTRTVGACTGSDRVNQDVFGTKNVTITAPTGTDIKPPTNPDYPENLPDEWARYLSKTDVNRVAGVQNVKTYTIDVFKDQPSAAQNSLLLNMARAGGDSSGSTYFQATSLSGIVLALERIFTEIQSVNSVFAAASLPVSATNRAQNENQVFFGLFRPEENALPRWYGNLKRYQIAKVGAQIILAGQDPTVNAINSNTGFFFDCVKSFWTTDSGTYWNFPGGIGSACPLPASGVPTSVYSDLPDGPQVEKGGAAEVLRRGNDPAATAPFTVDSRNMFSCANDGSTVNCSSLVAFADGTASITAGAFGTPAPTATERTNIINYTRGQNVKNERLDGDVTQPRPSIHGDVVHSRPLPINYGLDTDKSGTKVVVFYGANDGTLRAASTNDGRELWSFIAPEHHARLKRLYDNNQKVAFPNILAQHAVTPLIPAPAPKEYFFDGTMGALQSLDNSKIWLFPTMRRGGRMIYAFDVSPTDPSNPTPQTTPILIWRKGCTNPDLTDTASCDSGFEAMGQTWSTPNVAFIKNFESGTVPVIVMGGGYDTCEDKDGIVTSECDNAKGKKVYVLNANTGDVIRSFDTDRSVPADITLVDRDFDGFVDLAYAADAGGNVYRIDFSGADKGAWSKTKVAHTASGSGRKFLFSPAALVAKNALGNTVVYLGIGSGDRERPLLTNYPVTTSPQLTNRFYVVVDELASANVDLEALPVNNPLAALTSCAGWKMDLVGDPAGSPKVGEQTVTGALIAGGRVFWNTSRATTAAGGTCDSDLGEARGYNASLFSCGGVISTTYAGGGLPITPVLGTVTLADQSVVTVCIGCAMDSKQTSQFTPGKVNPAPAPTRKKRFWRRDGDK